MAAPREMVLGGFRKQPFTFRNRVIQRVFNFGNRDVPSNDQRKNRSAYGVLGYGRSVILSGIVILFFPLYRIVVFLFINDFLLGLAPSENVFGGAGRFIVADDSGGRGFLRRSACLGNLEQIQEHQLDFDVGIADIGMGRLFSLDANTDG